MVSSERKEHMAKGKRAPIPFPLATRAVLKWRKVVVHKAQYISGFSGPAKCLQIGEGKV